MMDEARIHGGAGETWEISECCGQTDKDDEVGAECGFLHAEFRRCSTETGYLFEVIDPGRRSCRLDLNTKAVRGRGLIMRLGQRTGQFRADTSILFIGYYGGPCRHELLM